MTIEAMMRQMLMLAQLVLGDAFNQVYFERVLWMPYQVNPQNPNGARLVVQVLYGLWKKREQWRMGKHLPEALLKEEQKGLVRAAKDIRSAQWLMSMFIALQPVVVYRFGELAFNMRADTWCQLLINHNYQLEGVVDHVQRQRVTYLSVNLSVPDVETEDADMQVFAWAVRAFLTCEEGGFEIVILPSVSDTLPTGTEL